MIRWGIGVVATILILVAVALSVGMNSTDKPIDRPKRQPTEAERIIAYCKDTDNKKSPLCTVDPEDPAAVRDAVRQILERQTTGPQVIERERETVRVADEDDDTPRVEVNVPRSEPTSQPSSPQPTQPPMMIPEIPDLPIPEVPDVPNVDLPLLP